MKVLLCYDIKFRRSCVDKLTSKKSQIPQNRKLEVTASALNFIILKPETHIKKKRNRSTKIGSSLENKNPPNLKHALKTSTSLIKTSQYKWFNNCFIICEMHFPMLKLD